MKAIQTSVIETGTGKGKKSIERFPGYYLCFWKETINNMLTVKAAACSKCIQGWAERMAHSTQPPWREFAKISKPNVRLWTKAFPRHFKYSYLILDCEAGAEMPSNILLLMKGTVGQWMSYWFENRFTGKTLQVVFISLRTVGATLNANCYSPQQWWAALWGIYSSSCWNGGLDLSIQKMMVSWEKFKLRVGIGLNLGSSPNLLLVLSHVLKGMQCFRIHKRTAM